MIQSVEITNFRGIKSMKFDCKKFNIFCGNSDQGKSSILEAIKWAVLGNDTDFVITNGESCAEVVLHSDNGTVIERKINRGEKSKVAIKRGDSLMPKPQSTLNKIYSPLLFNPVDMLRLSPKELNKEITEAIGKKIKLTEDQLKEYGLLEIKDQLLKSENIINDINEYYNTKYSKRAEQNKIVKTMSAKMGNVDLNVNEEDVKILENECNELESKIKKQNDKNASIEVSKKNILVKEDAQKSIKLLEESLKEVDATPLETLKDNYQKTETNFTRKNNELVELRQSVKIKEDVLSKISSGNVKCPISDDIKCVTPMDSCKQSLESNIASIKQSANTLFAECSKLDAEMKRIDSLIAAANNIENKKIELERLKSLVEQLQVTDEEIIPTVEMESELKIKKEKLMKNKISLELKNVSSLDEMKEIQDKLDKEVKALQKLINEIIPNMLKLDIKDVVLAKDGIFFRGLPFSNLGDSVKLRLCTAILKDIYKKANIYNLDGLECIDRKALKKYIEHYSNEDNNVQYFGTYVNDVDFIQQSPKIKIFNVIKFEVNN